MKSLQLRGEEAIIYLEAALKYANNNLSAAEYLTFLYLEVGRARDCLHLSNSILDKIELSDHSELALIINNNKAAALNILGRYSESILVI